MRHYYGDVTGESFIGCIIGDTTIVTTHFPMDTPGRLVSCVRLNDIFKYSPKSNNLILNGDFNVFPDLYGESMLDSIELATHTKRIVSTKQSDGKIPLRSMLEFPFNKGALPKINKLIEEGKPMFPMDWMFSNIKGVVTLIDKENYSSKNVPQVSDHFMIIGTFNL